MKTLDEVIKAWSICFSDNSRSNCTGCPYADEDGDAACFNHDREDALHYLKMYRSDQIQWEADREDWRDKWESYIEAREIHLEAVKELKRNDPLTWDELRTMEGKPVWIDSVPLVRRWVIIKKFHPIGGNNNLFDMEVEDGAHFLRKSMGRDAGAWWQAYRKERS